jgi:RNA polymerase sigma-70 factor (ECF subfamily)
MNHMALRKLIPTPNMADAESRGPRREVRSKSASSDPDELVVTRVLDGDVDAFQILIQRHQRPLYACAWQILRNPADAEEALQESFVQAFMKLHRLRERRYFLSWMWRICTTVATKWRSKTRRQLLGFDTRQAGGAESVSPAETKERDLAVVAAIAKLPVEQREAITLRYWEGLDYETMSSLTGVSEVALYQRVSRSLKALRKALGSDFLDGEVMSGHEAKAPLRMPRGLQDD